MRLVLAGLLVASFAFTAEPTTAPMPAERAAKLMAVPEGFKATLFAAEPDVVQPISFCFDDRGRIFVAEAMNYGEWKPTGKDRITILEDTDGDGKADKRTLFYEGFNYITGIEVGFGGVWVMSPPNLYFVPDRDGDDKPDGKPEVLFDGFGYKESRHNLANGFTWGPDGWLYAGHGRTSPSEVGRPGTPADKRIHCDGGVYRIHPTRMVFENFADGTTNPWGVDFDDWGQCFVSNCVNPHLFHMIQGGHYEPWRNRPASRYAYERLPTIADHLHYAGADLRANLGTDATLTLGGGHAHCGTLVYLGDSFPAAYRNSVLMCNVHGKRINRDILKRNGSGYAASHGKDFMLSPDPWFMGVTLRTGPDGSVYVSDWSDTGECHTYKPNTQNGRIYKISFGEPRKDRVDLAKKTDAELVELQLHKNDWFVRLARKILQERHATPGWNKLPVNAALRKMLETKELSTPQRLRVMWALQVTGGLDTEALQALLGDQDEHVRAWAIQLLCESSPFPETTVTKLLTLAKHESSSLVRLYLASALQRMPIQDGWALAEALLSGGNAKEADDPNLPLVIWYGIERLIASNPEKGMLLVNSARIPLLRRYISRRVLDDAILRKGKADLEAWVVVLKNANEASQFDVLLGARDALQGQKSMKLPTGWAGIYTELAKSNNASIRENAALLSLTFGVKQALADLRTVVQAKTNAADFRQRSLQALIDHRAEDLAPFLHELLLDADVRRTALRGLASIPHDETAKHLLAIYPKLNAEEKADAIATLASRKSDALSLLDAIERKQIPRTDVSAFVARQLYALGDAKITGRLKELWGEIRDTPADKQKQLAAFKTTLTPNYLRAADASKGRALFVKNCQTCHKLFGEGGTIGPDITGSNRSDLNYLLSNLVDPSAEVGKDYRMSVISTKNDRILTGIVVEKTPARVVIQTVTEKVTLAAEDVESVRDSTSSIMPDGQLDPLKKEEIRDLVAYLMSKTQVALPKK